MANGFKRISKKEAREKYGICISGASSMNKFYLRADGCVVDDTHSIRYIPHVASQQKHPGTIFETEA